MTGLVKHYKNDMKNIPQLSNTWGSMIGLLDKVLVEGFNFVPIVSLVKSSSEAITATITLGAGHGFIDRQVVRITGSTNGWNGDFKVLSANTDAIVVECLATHPIAIIGAASCSTAPLDFEIVFSTPAGSTEPKRAYRSTDPESLGLILLVHDFCSSGAATTGAKFAKVGVVSGMSDIDTITGTQMPFNESSPNANWGWDGTSHGWAKWYYAFKEQSEYLHYLTFDTGEPSAGSRSFYIVGDTASLALVIRDYCAYGFLEFDDVALTERNLALYAEGIHSTARPSQATGKLTFGRGALGTIYHIVGDSREKCQIWYDRNGYVNPQLAGFPIYAAVAPQDASSPSYSITSGQSLQVDAYIDKPLLDQNGYFRGILPFFKMSIKKSDSVEITSNGKVLHRFYLGSGDYWFALTLERK